MAPPVPLRRAPTGPHQLCFSCQSLGLTTRDFEPSFYAHGRLLFTHVPLGDLRKSVDCALCRLFVAALDGSSSTASDAQRNPGSVTCSARVAGYNHQTTLNFATLRLWTDGRESREAHLLPVHGGSRKEELGFLGRVVDPQAVSVPLLKRWLGKCLCEHGSACAADPKSNRLFHTHMDGALILIDVQARHLVYPAPTSARYLALSYVWGRKPMPMLTRPLLWQWTEEKSGAFAGVMATLPRTIQDAITVTQMLGVQYLWVDSLCIVQDDAASKAKAIRKMNLLYENAFLTIFAAAGSDADAGLPGVRAWSRMRDQPVALLTESLHLTCPVSHGSLRDSTWASRGWTLQEYYFAKRRLIFHGGLVFFRCAQSTWREDLRLEEVRGLEIEEFDMSAGFRDSIEKWELDARAARSPLDTRKRYFSIVHAYLRRRLTYEADILDAVAGIHDHFREQAGLAVHYGIPTETFTADMFWIAPESTALERRLQYPSWSWVGWKGGNITFHVNDAFVHQDKRVLQMTGWVAWYRWTRDDGFEDMAGSSSSMGALQKTRSTMSSILDSIKTLAEPARPETLTQRHVLMERELQTIAAEYKSQPLKSPSAVLFRTLTAQAVLSHETASLQASTARPPAPSRRTATLEPQSSAKPPAAAVRTGWFSVSRTRTDPLAASGPLGIGRLDGDGGAPKTLRRATAFPGSKFDALSGTRVRLAVVSGPLPSPFLGRVSGRGAEVLRVLLLYEVRTDNQRGWVLAERVGVGQIPIETLDALDFEEANVILH